MTRRPAQVSDRDARVLLHPGGSAGSLTTNLGFTGGGCTEQGTSAHFVVYYDATLTTGPTLASAVLASCERDYGQLQAWFGGITPHELPFRVYIVPGANGAVHAGCQATALSCDAFCGTNADLLRFLVVAGTSEVFMANQARG